MAGRLPRTLAAILYADVAGYSRLTGEDEDATHLALSDSLNRISKIIESHGGQVMHYAGDAVLAKFGAVLDALSGAVAIQEELDEPNKHSSNQLRVRFRIGVNIGDVIEDRGDIYGDGVNVAARLESLAEPGGVCISDAVRTAIGKKLPYKYVSIGDQRVKNIEEPVRAYQVVFDPRAHQKVTLDENTTDSVALEQSIAVLPFDNLGGNQDQEYFVDGLVEDIITELSKNPDLLVIARNSTFAFKGIKTDVRELGDKLGAHYLLEGSVRRSNDRLRVGARLIEVTTGHHVWAERYDRQLRDVFAVQDEIVESIVGALGGMGGKIDELARAKAVRKETDNLAAYDYFLRARDYLNRYSINSREFPQAREMFEKAIALDPNFHRAYVGLAWYHVQEIKFHRSANPQHSLQQAYELAQHAVEFDEPNGWSHMILGQVGTYRRQFKRAAAHYERALSLSPSDALVLMVVADGLTYLGRSKEATALALKAIRLNPNHPFWYQGVLAFSYFSDRKYTEALSVLERMDNLRLSPRLAIATYAKSGQFEKAKAAAKEFLKDNPGFSMACWAEEQPYENSDDLDHYLDGLRRADLPE